MSMTEPRRGRRWIVPLTGLLGGVGYLVVFLVHDDPVMAAVGFLIMAAYAVFLLVGSRKSETVALLNGELSDERRQQINLRVSTFTLNVLTLVLVGALFVSLARGHDGQPWALLCAVLAVAYLGATVYYSRRR